MKNAVAQIVCLALLSSPYFFVYTYLKFRTNQNQLTRADLIVSLFVSGATALVFFEIGKYVATQSTGRTFSSNGSFLLLPLAVYTCNLYSKLSKSQSSPPSQTRKVTSAVLQRLLLYCHVFAAVCLVIGLIPTLESSSDNSGNAVLGFAPLLFVCIAVSYFFWRAIVNAFLK